MRSQAYLIEAEKEEGLSQARAFAEEAFILPQKSPDISEISTDTFSVEDARRTIMLSLQKPVTSPYRVLIVAATHLYAEAQNALLKLFEEPPAGVTIFLIIPSRGLLLPTLRSRIATLPARKAEKKGSAKYPDEVDQFIFDPKARAVLLKKFASGKDDSAREKNRVLANGIINRVEELVYEKTMNEREHPKNRAVLSDLARLRILLHARSSPTRLILEHLALALPRDLVR